MSKEKILDNIINASIQKVNKLLPKSKRIISKEFKIKNNKLFDSLNYVTLLVELVKNFKKNFNKDPKLFDHIVFKDRKELKNYLKKKSK
tara:strand:+ start:906 stop:1172 length:267 start_codon:yes stop_codon:yes gene_type:complete